MVLRGYSVSERRDTFADSGHEGGNFHATPYRELPSQPGQWKSFKRETDEESKKRKRPNFIIYERLIQIIHKVW